MEPATDSEHEQDPSDGVTTKSPTEGSRPVPRTPAVVYFIRAGATGRVKIGISVNPYRRLAAMQTGSADRLEILGVIEARDARWLERQLHERFAEVRAHSEWFEPSLDLMTYIEDHTAYSYTQDYIDHNRQALIDSALRKRRAYNAGRAA